MKQYIIGAFALLLFCACDPYEWLVGHHAYWYIKNTTDKTLGITVIHMDNRSNPVLENETLTLASGDSIWLYHSSRRLGTRELPLFDDFLELDSIYVYDSAGEELHKWLKGNREVEERSVFKEETWRHYKELIGSERYELTWVYDIRSESLDHQ